MAFDIFLCTVLNLHELVRVILDEAFVYSTRIIMCEENM